MSGFSETHRQTVHILVGTLALLLRWLLDPFLGNLRVYVLLFGAIAVVVWLMALVGMVYGPMAAFMVEMFPARIRTTSLSLPYHLGVGILGGFLPFVASALVIYAGNIYAGLWYPVGLALATAVVANSAKSARVCASR